MGKPKNRVRVLYQNLKKTNCCKWRRPRTPSIDDAGKSAEFSSSPARTRTSTTKSPPRSPHPRPVPQTSMVSAPNSIPIPNTKSSSPVPRSIGGVASIHHPPVPEPTTRKNPSETDTLTVDSDPDNLDKVFEEAWKPGNGLSLADGSEVPWSKGRSSPSAAARYLDDIENGR